MATIFLDFDGVINVIGKPNKAIWPAEDWKQIPLAGFPICYAQPVVDFINWLEEHHTVIVLSTWGNDFNEFICPALGINGPLWTIQDTGDPEGWWKLAAIQAHMSGDDINVWIDDDIVFEPEAKVWNWPGLLKISPHQNTGITPKHINQIKEHISG